MEKINQFTNSYNLIAKSPSGEYISDYFKKFIDNLYPQKFNENPLRKAMLTGYVLRCTEKRISQWPLKQPEQKIKDILDSKENDFEKIEKLANYLDNHDKIGLPQKIFDYFLIPVVDVQQIFEKYAEDFITDIINKNKFNKEKAETFYEIAYRNIAFGYLYKLSEEFVEKFLKGIKEKDSILENEKNDMVLSQNQNLEKIEPNVWETRVVWILVGIFIVIGILFLSKTSSNEIQDQDYCDGSRNAYCP